MSFTKQQNTAWESEQVFPSVSQTGIILQKHEVILCFSGGGLIAAASGRVAHGGGPARHAQLSCCNRFTSLLRSRASELDYGDRARHSQELGSADMPLMLSAQALLESGLVHPSPVSIELRCGRAVALSQQAEL